MITTPCAAAYSPQRHFAGVLKRSWLRAVAALFTTVCATASAETLTEYVDTCKRELSFTAAQIPTNLNCNNGHVFNGDGNVGDRNRINDFFGYARLNDSVDLAFACRWLENRWPDRHKNEGPFLTSVSLEMLIHNRFNGKTCFFAAKPGPVIDPNGGQVPGPSEGLVSTAIVSPAAPNASNYWLPPAEVNTKFLAGDPNQRLRCVGCHVAGPYIASANIAPLLARFGLLNNGHDTFPHPDKYARRYQVVGQTFFDWNDLVTAFNAEEGCAAACHTVGRGSTVADIQGGGGQNLIPSLQRTISLLTQSTSPAMPPNDVTSPFRWVNMDHPRLQNPAGDGDYETLAFLQQQYPQFHCSNPFNVEAHAVGSADVFYTAHMSWIPDKLNTFNLQEGLVCMNSEQPGGKQCSDYDVRYRCGDGQWSKWFNTDSPNGVSDDERRSRATGLCASPTAIQARVTINTRGGMTPIEVNGPANRLYKFDTKNGLACRNQDQPRGQTCANYVVRFQCDTSSPRATLTLKSAWSGNAVTAIASTSGSETRAQPMNSTWSSQSWEVEPVAGSIYVRLKNVWSGKYLQPEGTTENAKVVTSTISKGTRQYWLIEPIAGGSDIRLKNVQTGRYATLVDTSTYSAILSQTGNTSWSSQRWILE